MWGNTAHSFISTEWNHKQFLHFYIPPPHFFKPDTKKSKNMLNTTLVEYEFVCDFTTTDTCKNILNLSLQEEEHTARSVMWSAFSKDSHACNFCGWMKPHIRTGGGWVLLPAYQTTQGCKFLSRKPERFVTNMSLKSSWQQLFLISEVPYAYTHPHVQTPGGKKLFLCYLIPLETFNWTPWLYQDMKDGICRWSLWKDCLIKWKMCKLLDWQLDLVW